MAESILKKQIGPFTGGVWILVIGGGVVLAIFLKKGFGGGTPKAVPIVVENVPLKGGATYGGNTPPSVGGDTVGGGTTKPPGPTPITPPTPGPTKPPAPPLPVLPPKPAVGIKPTIGLFTALPARVTVGQTVTLAWSTLYADRVQLVRPAGREIVPARGSTFAKPGIPGTLTYTLTADNKFGMAEKSVQVVVTPAPSNPPGLPPQNDVPGGYPSSCVGVLNPPSDHPGDSDSQIVYWMDHYMLGKDRGRGRALAWAVEGQGDAKLQSYARYVSNPLTWGYINGKRRTRGLRALTKDQFGALSAALTAQARSGRDSFPDSFVLGLWHAYHTPYLCRNSPRNTQSRVY